MRTALHARPPEDLEHYVQTPVYWRRFDKFMRALVRDNDLSPARALRILQVPDYFLAASLDVGISSTKAAGDPVWPPFEKLRERLKTERGV